VLVLHPGLPVAIAAVVLATPGYASGLLLQDRLLDLTPGELSGQALGLQSSGMLALQGVGAALAGAVAELTSPAAGIALMAVASLAVTAALTPGLRRPATRPVEEPAARAARPAPVRPTGPARWQGAARVLRARRRRRRRRVQQNTYDRRGLLEARPAPKSIAGGKSCPPRSASAGSSASSTHG
jgi:hypothetical protein